VPAIPGGREAWSRRQAEGSAAMVGKRNQV
jgi:hypothetical protein